MGSKTIPTPEEIAIACEEVCGRLVTSCALIGEATKALGGVFLAGLDPELVDEAEAAKESATKDARSALDIAAIVKAKAVLRLGRPKGSTTVERIDVEIAEDAIGEAIGYLSGAASRLRFVSKAFGEFPEADKTSDAADYADSASETLGELMKLLSSGESGNDDGGPQPNLTHGGSGAESAKASDSAHDEQGEPAQDAEEEARATGYRFWAAELAQQEDAQAAPVDDEDEEEEDDSPEFC